MTFNIFVSPYHDGREHSYGSGSRGTIHNILQSSAITYQQTPPGNSSVTMRTAPR